MESDAHVGQARDAPHRADEAGLRSFRRAWRSEQALVQGEFAQAAALMETVARTETEIEQTLRAMAPADGSEAATRRLRLAEAAGEGARKAAQHRDQLQRLADRWARQAELTALHQSLTHASRVLADLASTEEDIADILTRLASKDAPDLAEARRHLADEALAGAQSARDRALVLRKLAESAAGGAAPEGGPAGRAGNRT